MRPQLPTLTAWRNFGSQIDSYVSDHFGLRPYLLAAANRLNFAVRLPGGGNRVALLGKDDWLYWRNDIEQHSGLKLLGQWEIEAWTRSRDHVHDWLASQGIRFVFVIAPDKSESYPSICPMAYPPRPSRRWISSPMPSAPRRNSTSSISGRC